MAHLGQTYDFSADPFAHANRYGRTNGHPGTDDTAEDTTEEKTSEEKTGEAKVVGIVSRRLSQYERLPIMWLWDGRIARGKVILIAGHPGLGKSQVALAIAATTTTGGTWPDGSRAPKGNVIILSAEDDPADTLGPRFDAVDGDSDRVEIIEMVRLKAGVERAFSLRDDIALLAAKIEEMGDVVLIIIDPITAYLGDDVDSHKTADVRALLKPLADLAAKYGVAIVGVTHLRKNTDGDAVLLVTGSLAFVAASRATFFVMRDEEISERRLFLTAKNNLGVDTSGFAYEIEGFMLPSGIATSRAVWEPGTIMTGTVDDEIARRRKARGTQSSTRELEIKWLRELLAGGPVEVETIRTAVRAAGLTWRTVQRAAKDIGVFTRKTGGAGTPWAWSLP